MIVLWMQNNEENIEIRFTANCNEGKGKQIILATSFCLLLVAKEGVTVQVERGSVDSVALWVRMTFWSVGPGIKSR